MSEVAKTRPKSFDTDVKHLKRGGHLTPELLAGYQLGALSRAEGEQLIAHIAKCTDCAGLVVENMPLLTPSAPRKELRALSFGITDAGLVRELNEDIFVADDMLRLYLVADGLGGHGHGATAASIAGEAIYTGVKATGNTGEPRGPRPPAIRLQRAIARAHAEILAATRQDASLLGMGTTVVCGMLTSRTMTIAHVGDSRAYVRRNRRLELLTEDHTYVNERLRRGEISEAEARWHPKKNIITRALGGGGELRIDVQQVRARPGDLFLLCSDGLTTLLTDRQVNRWLGAADSGVVTVALGDIGRGLIQAANARGGSDNVTIVLIQIAEADQNG